MRGDVFRFKLTHFREIAVVYEKLPPGQHFRGIKKKALRAPVYECQRLSQLVVSSNLNEWPFNDSGCFLQCHICVYLSAQHSGVYNPPPQSSRVTIITVNADHNRTAFLIFSIRPLSATHLSPAVCCAEQRRIEGVQSRLCYSRRVLFHSHTVAFARG